MKSHLLFVLLIPVGFIHSTMAQPVVFNDVNLKNAVVEELSLEADSSITDPNVDEMQGLKYLYADNEGISDLTGLETATNLIELELNRNQASDLSPLSGLTHLESLQIGDNQISDISDLSGLTSLEELFLFNNAISDISALSGMTNLKRLNLHNTDVSDITALSGLTKLTSLTLSENHISDITALSGLTSMAYLYIYHNNISDISTLSALTSLNTLDLSDNSISDISDLSGLTNLEELLLSNNAISDVFALSGLTGLNTLDMSSNSIKDISDLSGLTNLEDLFLSDNALSDISALSGMTNLQELDLYNNDINDISALSGTSDIYSINLRNNRISDISVLAGLTALEEVNLRGNPLNEAAYTTYIPVIESIPYIHVYYDPQPVAAHMTLYVDDNAFSDPGPNDVDISDPNEDGTAEHPFDMIQEGIDAALEGFTVYVLPGRYYETLDLKGKDIRLNGLYPSTAVINDLPVIDANGLGTVMTFDQGEDANCVISGFVMTGGFGDMAGAITCIGSSPKIEHCLMAGNRFTDPNGGAVYLQDSNSVLMNNTITDNAGLNGGAGMSLLKSHPVISNSILWNNVPGDILSLGLSGLNVAYSTISDDWPGMHNLSEDPLFATPGLWVDPLDPNVMLDPADPNAVRLNGDYHLKSTGGRWDPVTGTWVIDDETSSAIDAGDPASDSSAEPPLSDRRINQGVYGGTSQASNSGNEID